nr:MAG TPA: hypothetical protein [Caudoviricetes sp.]
MRFSLNTRGLPEQRAKYARCYSRSQGCCKFCNKSAASAPPGSPAAACSLSSAAILWDAYIIARACWSGVIVT